MSNTEQNQTPKLTQETLFEDLVKVYNEMWELDLQIKQLMEKAKDADIEDLGLIKAVAKSKAYRKTSDLEDKAKATLAKIEELLG